MSGPQDADDLLRRARIEQAAERRSRRATWEHLAGEELDLRAVLAGPVLVTWAEGRRAGEVVALGRDYLALQVPAGRWHLRLDLVETVVPGGDAVAGGPDEEDRTLREVLARQAGTGATVVLRTRGGATVQGTVDAVGQDVIAVSPSHGPRCYVSSSSVAEALTGDGSG